MLKLSSTRNLCTTKKIALSRKNEREKHLSPSRRRALRPFFVQIRMKCKRTCSPGGLWGAAGDRQFHKVQSFEGKCSAVAQRCTGRSLSEYCWSARFHWAKIFKTWVSDGFYKTASSTITRFWQCEGRDRTPCTPRLAWGKAYPMDFTDLNTIGTQSAFFQPDQSL